jgi:phosphate/sulfate permease
MILLIAIIVLALAFDFINGFHDAANSISTIVTTKVLTPFQAVIWAAFFNFVAFFISKYIIGEFGIANTVSKTVYEQYITLPIILAGVIGAIIWNLFTWWRGIPSSSSHTLIGGFAGSAIMANGFAAIHGAVIFKIAIVHLSGSVHRHARGLHRPCQCSISVAMLTIRSQSHGSGICSLSPQPSSVSGMVLTTLRK